MKSHCCFIGTTLGDNPVPHHFIALGRELARRGHRVVIIAPHRRLDLEDPRGNPAIYTWPSERPTRLRDAMFLFRLIRQFQPSALIANFAAVNLMTSVGRFARVPHRIVWYHTISGQLSQDNPGNDWKAKLLNLRKRMVYHAATQVVANSAASAADVQAVYAVPPAKCRVFLNALADPLMEGDWPTAPTPGKLVCVGRFFRSKGQDVLLRALVPLKRKVPQVQVEFIGEGPSLAGCKELAQELDVADCCLFTGRVEHREVLKKMAGAVATVVPSRSEAFGLVNIESMAVGTPVVGSAVGGILEIIRDGKDGFLVLPDDPTALAARLETVLLHPQLRRELSRRARERFLADFEQTRSVREQADWQEALFENSSLAETAIKSNYGAPA